MRPRTALLGLGALVSSTLSLARSSYGTPPQIQVFLHPSPPPSTHPNAGSASAPVLTADQARAVLAHHLGGAVGDFDEIPADEGLWGHLVGLWGHRQGDDAVGGRVVIVDGGVPAQQVLPSTLPQEPAFYMTADEDATSMLAPYFDKAGSFFQDVVDHLPGYVKDFVDEFEMAGTKAAAALQKELSTLIALSEQRLIPFLSKVKHNAWEAVRISGLGSAGVEEGTEEYLQGTKSVKAGLEAMSQPDSPPLLVILLPSAHSQTHMHAPQRRQALTARAGAGAGADSQKCYASQDACSDATQCSERGKCALLGKNAEGECWGCKCASGYAGATCQKADYTVPFALLVFSAVFLVVLVMGSIALLASVGETKLPSTLTLAVGGHGKRD